jgi:glycosyltransferase involved in cell wall biosynthesis
MDAINQPKLLIFTSLFPSQQRPNAGIFIRERMFRVGQQIPITVVSPVPWFPLDSIIRYWKPGFRPKPNYKEEQNGVTIHFPRFFSIPVFFKTCDGFFMALGSLPTLIKLRGQFNIIDAHFAYPDGYAATLLGKWLKVPVTITLRGTEVPLSKMPGRKSRMLAALKAATRIFSVSDSLKQHVGSLGAETDKIRVVGNGVDVTKFYPLDKKSARAKLNILDSARVLISVGGLVDRKGFHRVIDVLPDLVAKYPTLIYLIVGGDSPEGNIRLRLEDQIKTLKLEQHVRFLGAYPSEELKTPLSASDLFVLATANEGWANVFLEAMACGLPVITTDVGGNQEVVKNNNLGRIVPFGDSTLLLEAIEQSLEKDWDTARIIQYALDNSWETRVKVLIEEFQKTVNL